MAADPTYPLYPIASILCAALLVAVLTTSFIRRSFNIGVFILSACLAVLNLLQGINSIVWADTNEVKAVVYCDISARCDMFLE
jgi:hypothetical protein